MTRRSVNAAITVAAAALLAATLTACGSSSGDRGATSGGATSSGSAGAAGNQLTVTITSAKGCTPSTTTLAAGGITITVTNKDATAVSEVEWLDGERIAGEKENVPPGFGGTFSVSVDAGTYTLYCPGANPEKSTVTVTGKANSRPDTAVSELLKQATTGYASYVNTQVTALVSQVAALNIALAGNDLSAAQTAYMKARPFYEKIEPVAESFAIGQDNLDSDIDMRNGDTPFAQWIGFHRIEYGLFDQRSLTGLAPVGSRLASDIAKLQKLTSGLTYKPVELANGAQELLDEVAASKITGEEESYSHIDLLDFANNNEGAEQAFAQLKPALTKIDPTLTQTITSAFDALDSLLGGYRTTSNASGYQLYTQLTASDKQRFAAAVKAVQEPLSQVASKVATQ